MRDRQILRLGDEKPLIQESQPHRQSDGVAALLDLAQAAAETDLMPIVQAARKPQLSLRRSGWHRLARFQWLLLLVLAIQTWLAFRLIWINTAFSDEALYLWAGHVEWAHWLHGQSVPAFATYFSGAPVVYPPIGALADSVGGLAAARMLSLGFMLGATSLLWGTASRLYGRRVAFFASALWVTLGPSMHLSAFATFDAMSLFLVALAAWFATARRSEQDAAGWMLAAAAALALANVTKYASALFDPPVVAMSVLGAYPSPGGKAALRRGALLLATLTGIIAVLLRIAGSWYMVGLSQTTTSRIYGTTSMTMIVQKSWQWVGLIAVLSLGGALAAISNRRSRSQSLLLGVLALTALLAPVEQARIHTSTSLDKHVDFGAWFAAMAAGYLVNWIIQIVPRIAFRAVISAAIAVSLFIPAQAGLAQARAMFGIWVDIRPFLDAFKPLAVKNAGPLLVENPPSIRYYMGASVPWQRWSSTWAVTLPNGKSIGSQGVTAAGDTQIYLRLVREGFFKIIALNYSATPALDKQIVAALASDNRYHRVVTVANGLSDYTIWVYARAPASRASTAISHSHQHKHHHRGKRRHAP